MSCTFYSDEFGTIKLKPGLPANFKGPFLSGGTSSFFSGSEGTIILQELHFDFGSLCYLLFDFLEKVQLKMKWPSGLHALMLHEGEVFFKFQQQGRLHARPYQFALSHFKNAGSGTELVLKRAGILMVRCNEGLVKELTGAFPGMEPLLTGKDKRIAFRSAHHQLRESVHQILHAEYEPSALPFYFKNKIGEYLFLLLAQIAKRDLRRLVATSWELKAVARVRDIILEDILKHYSIEELAKKEKINDFRLKVFFKREFGVGPYEFLLNNRLEKAKELLEQGLPMKQAAPMAGYRLTSFAAAFKKKYGYTPGTIQRMQGKL